MSKKFTAAGIVTAAILFSGAAFAQSGNVNIPGVGSASGSKGSTITNSRITVSNNTARDVTAGGGEVTALSLGSLKMAGMANVNTVNITGSTVEDSTISVTGNSAQNIKAIGGTANVNSVNIN